MVFKCKICGGTLDVKQGERTVVCEYCGVRQSIPSFIEPKTQEIYDRANNYLMHNEFDKAENLYAQILFDNKTDADAYWNILMCHYGVTYVKDPKTGQYIPTCNRTLFRPIFNDPNYENAIKYASDSQRQLYIHDAQTIDNIQKGILSVSKREKPFDIFISYKETNVKGARTKDSIAAQDLYEKLTAEGYKVFFSRITLEDKIGTEYEPYIYAALASSNVMITVCSSKENIESVWVKNEWSRFLGFAAKDSTKTLIPLYFDMDKAELPEDFAYLPAYNMKLPGFEQEFIRGIKKLIPLPVMLLEKRKKRNKILKRIGLAAAVCAAAGVICTVPWFMKLPDYNTAMQLYYDRNYPEATWAFADLGSYRDSEEMKDKCERSWRNSLATVVLKNDMGLATTGTYYINNNVEVNSFFSDPGNMGSADNIHPDEHGKITSITLGYPFLYALHEDGYVDNVAENNDLPDVSDWNDIVQISPFFNSTNIALKADGSMIYGDLNSTHFHKEDTDEWLSSLSEWSNIVSFDYSINRAGNGSLIWACVTGIQSDGNLKIATYSMPGYGNQLVFDDSIIENFHDVQKVKTCFTYDNQNAYINICALGKDGTLQVFSNGKFSESKIENILDLYIYDGYKQMEQYFLTNSGKYMREDEDFILLEDVVSIQNDFLVTRVGTIFENTSITKCDEKAIVYNEWIERMQ